MREERDVDDCEPAEIVSRLRTSRACTDPQADEACEWADGGAKASLAEVSGLSVI